MSQRCGELEDVVATVFLNVLELTTNDLLLAATQQLKRLCPYLHNLSKCVARGHIFHCPLKYVSFTLFALVSAHDSKPIVFIKHRLKPLVLCGTWDALSAYG